MKSVKNEVYRTYEGIVHWVPSVTDCKTGCCWCNPSWEMIESKMSPITEVMGAGDRF